MDFLYESKGYKGTPDDGANPQYYLAHINYYNPTGIIGMDVIERYIHQLKDMMKQAKFYEKKAVKDSDKYGDPNLWPKVYKQAESQMKKCIEHKKYLQSIQGKMPKNQIKNAAAFFKKKLTKESADDFKLEVYESWNNGILTDSEKNFMINYINESVEEE